MTNTRTTTWANVGTDIKKAKSVEQALKISGLDYTVEKVPVFLENGLKVPGAFCTKRTDSDTTYGVVGSQFELVQNQEGFEFIDGLCSEGLKFLKAGETSKMVYIIASLPTVNILGDDFTPHAIFQNSHGGHTTLKATIAPLRIVCQNQFNLTFRNSTNTISLRHTKSIQGKLSTAQEVLVQNTEYMTEFQKQATLLAAKKISKNELESIANATFHIDPECNPTQLAKAEEKKQLFLTAYNSDDNQNFKGTAWGVINAYSDYITHKPMMKSTEQARENRFIKTTLKRGINDFVTMVKNI